MDYRYHRPKNKNGRAMVKALLAVAARSADLGVMFPPSTVLARELGRRPETVRRLMWALHDQKIITIHVGRARRNWKIELADGRITP